MYPNIGRPPSSVGGLVCTMMVVRSMYFAVGAGGCKGFPIEGLTFALFDTNANKTKHIPFGSVLKVMQAYSLGPMAFTAATQALYSLPGIRLLLVLNVMLVVLYLSHIKENFIIINRGSRIRDS